MGGHLQYSWLAGRRSGTRPRCRTRGTTPGSGWWSFWIGSESDLFPSRRAAGWPCCIADLLRFSFRIFHPWGSLAWEILRGGCCCCCCYCCWRLQSHPSGRHVFSSSVCIYNSGSPAKNQIRLRWRKMRRAGALISRHTQQLSFNQ